MRLRAPILVKLLAALVLPTIALFTLFAFVAHRVSRQDLDDELGRRLEAIAAAAASQIRDKQLLTLVPGDEERPAYQGAVRRLRDFAQATGAHLSLFAREPGPADDPAALEQAPCTDGRDPHPFATCADGTGAAKIGDSYTRAELDRVELERVFERGETASSVTFAGEDGKIYKAGYAPVQLTADDSKKIVLAISAQAPASYFARLEELRESLFAWGAGLVAISILAAVITTLFITRNVRRLAAAAERIGGGDLRERVQIASGDELGVLGQTMDRMRQQLAERDARTQQMLAGIAHEVRNPLAGMTLFTGILRDEIPDGDERRGHVDKIQRELGYLERVVNDFLEYARRPKPELAPVDVGELLAEVAQLASTPDVEVAITRPQGEGAEDGAFPPLRADHGQLRRALLNLAKNAVQAATAAGHRGRGAVSLTAHPKGDEVHLAVWNRGAEISPETSGKLFEPFFTTREKGTGLGLAFVREIAVDHGGRVDLESADGQTTFTIALPA